MKRLLTLALAALISIAASLPLIARPPHGRPGGHGPGREYFDGDRRHHDRPAPPPRHHDKKHKHHKKRHHHSGREFNDLVYRASYGAPNVQVYSMGDDIYVVRYARNGRYYMRRFNPVTNAIFSPQAITLNGRGWYLTSNPSYYYTPNGSSLNLNIGSGRGPNININLPIGR